MGKWPFGHMHTIKVCVRKQPIIAPYFEFENELKFYNRKAKCVL